MATVHTLATAKRDFELGYLTRWSLERAAMGGGWFLRLSNGGMAEGWLCDARKREPRRFASLDVALGVLESIGFHVDFLH